MQPKVAKSLIKARLISFIFSFFQVSLQQFLANWKDYNIS